MKSLPSKVALWMAILPAVTSTAWGQDVVQYRLGLGGTYVAPPLVENPFEGGLMLKPPPFSLQECYVHGNEADGQAFDPAATPLIRWDAVAVVTGNNYGAANLVADLAVRSGSVDGPVATQAVFSGDNPDSAAGNFSIGISTSTGMWATIIDSVGVGGPNMTLYSRGVASPGQLLGIGAGYINWNSPQSVRPGVGVAADTLLPNGSPGLGHNPTFDGKINISALPAGTYYLVLSQGIGVNVLKPELNPTQSTGSFAKAANQHPTASIRFIVGTPTNPPPDDGGTQPPSDGGGNTGGNDTSGNTGSGDTGGGQDGTPGGSTGGDEPTSNDQPGGTQTDGTQGDNAQNGSDGQSSTEDATPLASRPFAFCGSGSAAAVVGTFLGLLAVPHLRRRPDRTRRNS